MRALLVATAVAGSLLVAAPAQAHPSYHYEGGCGYVTTNAPEGGEDDTTMWQGVAFAVVAATFVDPVPAPTVSISVECHFYKNGVYQGVYLSASGTGVAATASVFVFPAAPSDIVTTCEVVVVGGDHHTTCEDDSESPLIPEPVGEAIESVVNEVNGVLMLLDPTLCPVLGSLSPGIPGVVDITPEGDMFVAGLIVRDCPPYGWGGGPGVHPNVGTWATRILLPYVW